MQKCYGEESNSIVLDANGDQNLKQIILNNSDKFIDYLHKIGLEVVHHDKTLNNIYTSNTSMTFKTTCFKVDFNDTFARITALK
jgi:hypothetical protein